MENSFFAEALADFVSESAYKKAVLHLHHLGCSVPEIEKQLDYPVSRQRIEDLIEKFEMEKDSPGEQYTYVQDVSPFGRKSFRRVKIENSSGSNAQE